MNKTLIITGGEINKEFLKKYLEHNIFNNIIASDKGINILSEFDIVPDYIVGDFDSADLDILSKYKKNDNIIIKELEKEKDYTDTHVALNLAIEIKSEDIVIMGATGIRLDHFIANIEILYVALKQNIQCRIIDPNNEIQLISNYIKLIKKNNFGKYISLIPFTDEVTGVTLKGFKYLLNNATMKKGESIGVSNEQIDDIAEISLKSGILILISSKDD